MLAQATRVNTRILRQRSAGPYDDTYISRFIQISHLHFLLYASTPHEEGAPPTLLLPSVKYSKLIKLVTELQMLVQLMDYSNSANFRSSFVDGSSSMANSNSSKEKKKAGKKTKDAVKLSTEPQSMAARERRHRISARFKILQGMVPDGTKMDSV